MLKTTLLTIAILGIIPSASQASEMQSYTSLTEFNACLPLADGRVLAGSAGGLLVIDKTGTKHSLFTALDGLPATKIRALEIVEDGVWVGTSRGAALIEVPAFHTKSPLVIRESFASKPVWDFLSDGKSVYVATWGQGLQRWKEGTLSAVGENTDVHASRVTSVAKMGDSLWWTSAGGGLWQKRGNATALQSDRVSAKAILWSLDTGDGDLLISGEEGVYALHGTTSIGNVYSARATATIDGKPWVASFGLGLRTAREAYRARGLHDAFARSLRSEHGISCMGTQTDLWIRAQGSKVWAKTKIATSLPSNDVAAFASNGVETYVGTFDHGVARLLGSRFVPIAAKHDRNVNALAIDRKDGALWIATSSELVRVHKGRTSRFTKRNGLPSRHIMSLFALSDGGVLVGTAHGAATVQSGLVHILGGKRAIATGNVWSVAQTKDGANWLGTTRGLFRVHQGKISRYRVISGELKDDWVMALAPAHDGIFVGTYKAGVVRLRVNGDQVTATQLGDGWVNPGGMHWDGKTLRVATMYGARRGNGISATWHKEPSALGIDTTAFVPSNRGGQWIVTRDGLSLSPAEL